MDVSSQTHPPMSNDYDMKSMKHIFFEDMCNKGNAELFTSLTVTTHKLVYASGSVHQFRLTCVEWVRSV